METGFVTSKGQIVIPSRLRRKFGIKPGTRVNFIDEADSIRIIPITSETIKSNIGFLGKDGPSLLKALMEEKKKEREL